MDSTILTEKYCQNECIKKLCNYDNVYVSVINIIENGYNCDVTMTQNLSLLQLIFCALL